MEDRRNRFRENAGNPGKFRAIEGQQIVEILQDDDRIVLCADQQEAPEKTDIVAALPCGAERPPPT